MNDTGTRSQVGSSQEWKSYVESREESTANGDDTRRKAFPGKRLEKLNKKRPFRQHIEAESNSSHEKRVLMVREEDQFHIMQNICRISSISLEIIVYHQKGHL